MEKRYKIAIDVMGSDAGVGMMVRGAKLALEKRAELICILVTNWFLRSLTFPHFGMNVLISLPFS